MMITNSAQKGRNEKPSRRKFLKTAALGTGLLSTFGSFNFIRGSSASLNSQASAGDSEKLQLNVAGYDYNRVKALADGRVGIDGCDITYAKAGIGDMNSNIFSGPQTYDVTEIGLHPFMLAYANDGFRDYTLLPIFPLRLFRHKSVFIHTDRGINKPEDLKGRTVGTTGYSSSSLTWLRGIFQDEYGIKPEDVEWVTSKKDSGAKVSGKASKQELLLPEGVKIKTGPEGLDESDLLLKGEVDALFHAVEPKAFAQGNPKVVRLFQDSRRVEQAYYKKTSVFPIMHAVAVRNKLIDENPWLLKNIFEAYSKAKQVHHGFMKKIGWAYDSLPWYAQELEQTKNLMGENFYSYGMEPNRKTLETLFRYSYEQGLSSRLLTIEELFHTESLKLLES